MSNLIMHDTFALRRLRALVVYAALLLTCYVSATAAAWHNIEPLKSRRAGGGGGRGRRARRGDVERELGKPLTDAPGAGGALHFKVAGGMVTVTFVSAKFVATKKLAPEYEGAVLEVVLQHDNAPDTPDSLKLTTNSDFDHDSNGGVDVYRNL